LQRRACCCGDSAIALACANARGGAVSLAWQSRSDRGLQRVKKNGDGQ
jgi:hypothetical protein